MAYLSRMLALIFEAKLLWVLLSLAVALKVIHRVDCFLLELAFAVKCPVDLSFAATRSLAKFSFAVTKVFAGSCAV